MIAVSLPAVFVGLCQNGIEIQSCPLIFGNGIFTVQNSLYCFLKCTVLFDGIVKTAIRPPFVFLIEINQANII